MGAREQDGGVSVIDTDTKKVVATIPALTKHSNRLKFTLDGKLVLISDAESNQVLVMDTKERKVVQKITVGEVPLGIQIAPDGQLYICRPVRRPEKLQSSIWRSSRRSAPLM